MGVNNRSTISPTHVQTVAPSTDYQNAETLSSGEVREMRQNIQQGRATLREQTAELNAMTAAVAEQTSLLQEGIDRATPDLTSGPSGLELVATTSAVLLGLVAAVAGAAVRASATAGGEAKELSALGILLGVAMFGGGAMWSVLLYNRYTRSLAYLKTMNGIAGGGNDDDSESTA